MSEIPILSLKIGGRYYKSKSSRDITLTRDDKTHQLCIKVQVEEKKAEPLGTYVLNCVSGESLFLHSVNGSLEEMVIQVLLETNDLAYFKRDTIVNHVRCNMLFMEASVEEAGHIRKLLMETRIRSDASSKLYEGIPRWSLWLPWWLYSKRLRVIIQQLLIFYTVFNTLWALWQLYRHVDIIRDTLEPVIVLLQETCHIYVSFAMEIINTAMEYFNNFWWRFFAPLKVLVGPLWNILWSQIPILINPLLKLVSLFYSLFGQIFFPILSVVASISIATTWLLWYMISTLLRPAAWLLWLLFSYASRPIVVIIQYFPGMAKSTVDPVKVLVRNLLLNSFKSLCNLLLWMAKLARLYKFNETSKKPTHYKQQERQMERRRTTDF